MVSLYSPRTTPALCSKETCRAVVRVQEGALNLGRLSASRPSGDTHSARQEKNKYSS